MNVSDLVSALQKMPPDLPVVVAYDDAEYGETFDGNRIEVSQETLKLTGTVYDRNAQFKGVGSRLVELPFTNKEVVLLSVVYHD